MAELISSALPQFAPTTNHYKLDDGRYVLVISYNSTHIRYYDPVLGAEVKVTRKAFENSLSLQSNTMYTFSVQ